MGHGGCGRQRVKIINERGLHARAAARFVKLAERFQAKIMVHRDGQSVAGTSIMGLLMLAAASGSHIDIEAAGDDADTALAAMVDLVEGGFGEIGPKQ